MKVIAGKRASERDHREWRSWRPWLVCYRNRDRIEGVVPSGVLITDSAIVPLPIAFISNSGRDAVRLAIRIIRGKASFAGCVDYRGKNWIGVGARINGAILYPLSPMTGKTDVGIDHLDAAQVFIDPLTGAISFHTMDYAGLRNYLSTQNALDWAIPRAFGRGMVELAI